MLPYLETQACLFYFLKRACLLLFLSRVFVSNTYADNGDRSGGGDAVICFKDSGSLSRAWELLLSNEANGADRAKTSIFDLPEIRSAIVTVKSYDLALFENTLNPLEKHVQHFSNPDPKKVFDLVLANLSKKTNLDQIIKKQMKPMTWIRVGYVPPIDDSGRGKITFPGQCLVVQMALRQDNEILFNAGLFDLMDPINKAGLVLHEVLYKIAKIFGAPNSKKIHSLVGLFFNKDYLLSLNSDELAFMLLENLYQMRPEFSKQKEFIADKCRENITPQMKETLCELTFAKQNQNIVKAAPNIKKPININNEQYRSLKLCKNNFGIKDPACKKKPELPIIKRVDSLYVSMRSLEEGKFKLDCTSGFETQNSVFGPKALIFKFVNAGVCQMVNSVLKKGRTVDLKLEEEAFGGEIQRRVTVNRFLNYF